MCGRTQHLTVLLPVQCTVPGMHTWVHTSRFNQVDLVILNLNEVSNNSIAYNQILVLSVVKLLYTVLVLINEQHEGDEFRRAAATT